MPFVWQQENQKKQDRPKDKPLSELSGGYGHILPTRFRTIGNAVKIFKVCLSEKKEDHMTYQTLITAHSGCEETPIDRLESIDKALIYGADAVEIDIRVDRSGTLRISHNKCSIEEYIFKITFRDVLEKILRTDLILNCDLKEQAGLYKVIEEAEKIGFPRERLYFSGCVSPEQLIRDRDLSERANFFLNIEEVLKFAYLRNAIDFSFEQLYQIMNDPWSIFREKEPKTAEEWASEKAKAIIDLIADTICMYRVLMPAAANIPYRLLATPIDDALREAGIPLSVWTVNDPLIALKCLNLNVRNITTRKVQQTVRLRQRQNQP